MTTLKEILEAKWIPPDIALPRQEIVTLIKMHKGLLKENERNKAFWRSTNENLEHITKELERTNQELREVRDQLWGEMQLAKKIQTVLLPEGPTIPGYQLTAYMNPAEEVGGDYYDIINTDNADWLVIGDVSGHGVPAGLVMMMTQTAIRVALHQDDTLSPSKLLSIVNRTLRDNIQKMKESKYLTVMALSIMPEGHIRYSGLHQDILVYRCGTKSVERIQSIGIWLGLVDDTDAMLNNQELTLEIGDTALLFTDGITEAIRRDDSKAVDTAAAEETMFGEQRLIDLLSDHGEEAVQEIQARIVAALESYRCNDDVSMVIAKRIH